MIVISFSIKLSKFLLGLFIVGLLWQPLLGEVALAQTLGLREARYDEYFSKVGRYFGIPSLLLKAIARQESSCQPLVININGLDYHPKTSEEALSLISKAEAQGLSYDVGLMQINRYWLRKYNLSPKLLLNPRNNIFMGGGILAQEIQKSGLNWEAIGHYHSHTPWRAEDYAQRVRRHLLHLLSGG